MENTNVTEQSTNEIMPMAASGETNFASLPEKTTPASGDMFLMEDSEDTKKINYDKLADAILNKLTSKTYSGLETTAKNFVTAINELNSKWIFNRVATVGKVVEIPITTSNSYLVVIQHEGGSGYYIGIAIMDRSYTRIFKIGTSKDDFANIVIEDGMLKLSCKERWWWFRILKL